MLPPRRILINTATLIAILINVHSCFNYEDELHKLYQKYQFEFPFTNIFDVHDTGSPFSDEDVHRAATISLISNEDVVGYHDDGIHHNHGQELHDHGHNIIGHGDKIIGHGDKIIGHGNKIIGHDHQGKSDLGPTGMFEYKSHIHHLVPSKSVQVHHHYHDDEDHKYEKEKYEYDHSKEYGEGHKEKVTKYHHHPMAKSHEDNGHNLYNSPMSELSTYGQGYGLSCPDHNSICVSVYECDSVQSDSKYSECTLYDSDHPGICCPKGGVTNKISDAGKLTT